MESSRLEGGSIDKDVRIAFRLEEIKKEELIP